MITFLTATAAAVSAILGGLLLRRRPEPVPAEPMAIPYGAMTVGALALGLTALGLWML